MRQVVGMDVGGTSIVDAAVCEAAARGVVLENLGACQVTERAATDPAARQVLADTMHLLTRTLAPSLYLLGPIPLVLGGGPAAAGKLLTEPLHAQLAAELSPLLPTPPVLTARLGDKSQMIGAAALVFASEESAN